SVRGEGRKAESGRSGLDPAYARGESDECAMPTVLERPGGDGSIARGDTVIAYNTRPDRMRQLSRALADPSFDAFPRPRGPLALDYVCMTSYDETFTYPVLYTDEPLRNPLGEVISREGIRQLRIAETKKYLQVT